MDDEVYDEIFPGDDDMRGFVPGHNRALQDRLAERAVARSRGRPAKTDADKRRQWDVRLTPAAIAAVTAAAALDGQPPRTWAAHQLAQAAARRLATTDDQDRAAPPAGAPRPPAQEG